MLGRLREIVSFDTAPGQRKERPVRWGLLAAIVLGVGIPLWILQPNPFADAPRFVRAHFATPQHVFPNSYVRVNGLDVGKVVDQELQPDNTSIVTLEIQNTEVVVREDARAAMLFRTIFGRNVYVELDPGSTTRPEIGDRTIPLSRTGSQVEVDEVLRPFEPTARRGGQKFFSQVDDGLDGAAPRESLRTFGPVLTDTGTTLTTIRGQEPGSDLPRLVRGGVRATGALNADEEALVGLLDHGAVALGVTAARRADIDDILDEGEPTLVETRRTMVRLRETLDVAESVATALRPGVRSIGPAARAATPTVRKIDEIVPVAIPTLRDLRPALVSLRDLSQRGVPLIDALDPTLERTGNEIVPFLDTTREDTKLKNSQAIGPAFATVSDSASTFDDQNFMQRFQPGGRNFASGAPPTFPFPLDPDLCPAESRAVCEQLFEDLSDGFDEILAADAAGGRR